MSVFTKLIDAFRPEHNRPVVIENEAIRSQVAKLRDEAEQTVRMIDRHTGIWHQDMLEGVYQGEHRPRDFDRA
jgi:hypothetical protein